MDDSAQTLAVVRDVFAAFDAHDLDRFRALLAPDVVLDVGGGAQTFEGPDGVVAAVGATFAILPDLRVAVANAFASGARGVAEVVREGTHTGAVPLPDGTEAPPTGRAVRLPECAVSEVRGGAVARMAVCTDRLDTSQQLGLL